MTSHPSFNQPTTTSDLSFVHFFLTKKNFKKKSKMFSKFSVVLLGAAALIANIQVAEVRKQIEKSLTKYNLKFVLLQINQSPKSFN
jgi:hypothetical protein